MKYLQEVTDLAVSAESILAGRCFLCGGLPSTGDGEHVIARWLQRAYDLYDESLTLLNGTLIRYRQLTVPCCVDCNTGYLSGLETRVQAIISKGEVSTPDEASEIGRWMAKILVGILVKETGLFLDRSTPALGKIAPADVLEDFRHCHLVLQSGRKRMRFEGLHGPHPFSFYWYRVSGEEGGFDLSTNLVGQSIAMRVGRLGMAFVNDGGLQMEAGVKGPFGLNGATVSPTQFSELAARIHYKGALRNATHFYINAESPEELSMAQVSVRPFSGLLPSWEIQLFDDWNDADFGPFAEILTGIPRAVFFDETTGVPGTCLGNLLAKDLLGDDPGKLVQQTVPRPSRASGTRKRPGDPSKANSQVSRRPSGPKRSTGKA